MMGHGKSKRYRKVERGLNFCLVAACFLICLLAAVLQAWEECRIRGNQQKQEKKQKVKSDL